VVRDAETLSRAGTAVDALAAALGAATPKDRAEGELANLVTAAKAVLRSAVVRRETRGAHARSDYPEASEQWRRRIIHRGQGIEVSIEAPPSDPGVDPSSDVGPHVG
jgi:L-aspartate oxidase